MSSTATYSLLREAASAVGSWDSQVAAARDLLGRRDRGSLVDVYVRVVESILETTDRREYRAAVKQLKNARRAAVAAGLTDEHHAYLVALREEHRRRPTLAAMLDKLIEG